MLLLLPATCALLIITTVLGLRLLRTTGLEDVERSFRPLAADGTAPERGLGPLLDRLGARFLGVATRAYGPERLKRLDLAIQRAGSPEGLTVTTYVRRQAGFTVLALIFFVIFLLVGTPALGVFLALVLLGWMRVWLSSIANKRQATMDSELPDFLDVLAVTVAAGLGFRQAVERVAAARSTPLAEELTTVLREMAVGVPRREAFRRMRERTRSDAVGSFVTAMLQAEELGVPLAAALQGIADEVRKEHAAAVRQRAAKAAPKVSLAVTFTVLPGAMILIGSAVVLSNLGALSGIL